MRFLSSLAIRFRGTEGSNLIELALVLPILLLILAAGVDLGEAFYTGIQLSGAAHDGAVYGIHNPTDTAGMKIAAQESSANLAGFSASATYGCECSDGSAIVPGCGAPPACSSNYVNYVDVAVTASYSPIISFPGLPTQTTFTSKARMRVGGD